MRHLALSLCLAAACVSARAEFVPGDGTDLRAYVQQYEATRTPGFQFQNATDAYRVGVLVGYVDALSFALEAQKAICLPKNGLSSANYLDLVSRYLKKTPRANTEVGAVLVTAALQEVFPCRR
jgi:hypothetical protein